MKKTIIAIIAVITVAAIAVGGYFIFSEKDSGDPLNLTVRKDEFTENGNLLLALIKNPDRYRDALANEYGMGEKTAGDFYDAPENWLAYEQIISITNNSEENITVYGFEVEGNGRNGVYVNTKLGGDLGISPGGTGPASFSVLFEDGDLTIEECKALVDEMNIKVVFSKTPAEYDDGSESVEETKTAVIEKLNTK